MIKYPLLAFLYLYKAIAPLYKNIINAFTGVYPECRYKVRCSDYCIEIISKKGSKGLPECAKRVLSCH